MQGFSDLSRERILEIVESLEDGSEGKYVRVKRKVVRQLCQMALRAENRATRDQDAARGAQQETMKQNARADRLAHSQMHDKYAAAVQERDALKKRLDEAEALLRSRCGNVCPHAFCNDCARDALAGYDFEKDPTT